MACIGSALHGIDVQTTSTATNTPITFKDMKVSIPKASMRKTIKAGNGLYITENGGIIDNRKSARRSNFKSAAVCTSSR